MSDGIVSRQQVRLTGTTPHTRVWKAFRHLRTNIHWSKAVNSVKEVGEYTIELNEVWAELRVEVQHFSVYYPHVLFHVYEPVGGRVQESRFLNGEQVFVSR